MTISNIKADKMRYQNNRFSYLLVMLSIVLSLIALFTNINFDQFISEPEPGQLVYLVKPDMRVGIEIAIGIIMMLVMFMSAEKVKFYDAFWSNYGLFVLAGINVLRAIHLPLYALDLQWIPLANVIAIIVEYTLSGALLIAAGLIATGKYHKLHKHLKEINIHGNHAV